MNAFEVLEMVLIMEIIHRYIFFKLGMEFMLIYINLEVVEDAFVMAPINPL